MLNHLTNFDQIIQDSINIEQVHYYAENDKVVPPDLVRTFMSKFNKVKVIKFISLGKVKHNLR